MWHLDTGEKSAECPVLFTHLGYMLEESTRDRAGYAIATNIQFWRKIDGISNHRQKKRLRAMKVVTMTLIPNEIMLSLRDVAAEAQLTEEHKNIREKAEE